MDELLAPLLAAGGVLSDEKKRMPLSTPDLHYILETVHLKGEEIKDRIYTTVRSHHAEFLDLAKDASKASLHVEEIFAEFQNVLDNLAPHRDVGTGLSYDSKIWNLSAEVQRLRTELSSKQNSLSSVNLAIELRDDILAAKTTFHEGTIVGGAAKLAELHKRLLDLTTEFRDSQFYGLLEKLYRDVSSEVESTLQELFDRAVSLDAEKRTLTATTVEFSGRRLDAATLLEAMDVLGTLDSCFTRFVDGLQRPLVVIVNEFISVHKESQQAMLSWAKPAIFQSSQAPKEAYDRVLMFVNFIHEHVVDHQKDRMRKLGRLIWPKLADLLINGCLRKVVPTDPKQFQEFQQVQQLTAQFEKDLQREDFIVLKGDGGKLTHFASEMEVHFASKKKNQVLAKARDLIVKFDYDFFLRQVWHFEDKSEFLFRRDDFPVSYLPKQLLFIVHEVLKDACSCPPRIAFELFQTARDVVLLFRAVVASTQSKRLMLQAAFICHNDCLYIAHELLGIAYEYRSLLPVELEKSCSFVDLVPVFQTMAENFVSEQLLTLKNTLMQTLYGANGFRSTDESRNRAAAEQALDEVVLLLESVLESSEHIFSKAAQRKLLLELIDFIMEKITSDVLCMGDMSADETTQLHNLLEHFNEKLVSNLRESSLDLSEGSVLSWRKLIRLASILEMSLRSITKAWEDGELKSAGFTSKEVCHLIEVIFTHTSLRAECLERIR